MLVTGGSECVEEGLMGGEGGGELQRDDRPRFGSVVRGGGGDGGETDVEEDTVDAARESGSLVEGGGDGCCNEASVEMASSIRFVKSETLPGRASVGVSQGTMRMPDDTLS